eukprot:6779292-Prymnesium_polylepis.1
MPHAWPAVGETSVQLAHRCSPVGCRTQSDARPKCVGRKQAGQSMSQWAVQSGPGGRRNVLGWRSPEMCDTPPQHQAAMPMAQHRDAEKEVPTYRRRAVGAQPFCVWVLRTAVWPGLRNWSVSVLRVR